MVRESPLPHAGGETPVHTGGIRVRGEMSHHAQSRTPPLTSLRHKLKPKLTLELKSRTDLSQLHIAVVCLLVDMVPEEKGSRGTYVGQ